MFIVYLLILLLLIFWIAFAIYFYQKYIKLLNQTGKNKIDPITKVNNKSSIEQYLTSLLNNRINFTILMYDIDKFKLANNNSDQKIGDIYIKILAHLSKYNIRSSDFIGRYESDKFIIILKQTEFQYALQVAERLRKKTEERKKFTISIGVLSYDGLQQITMENILKEVNKILDDTKNYRCNCIKISGGN